MLGLLPIRTAPTERIFISLVAIFLAVTAAMPAGLLGTSFQDNTIAVLLASAVWACLRVGFAPSILRGIFVAFLLSLAVSLKATSIFFGVAHGFAFYSVMTIATDDRRGAAKEFCAFCSGCILMTSALSAPWMIEVYAQTGNPVFPMANNLFKSPLFYPTSFMDTQMLPNTFGEFVAYPWSMATGSAHTSEASMADSRYLIAFLLFIGWVGSRVSRRLTLGQFDPGTTFLSLYLVLAFLLWRSTSSMQRYFVFGDLLIAVLIVRMAVDLPRRLSLPALLLATGVHALTVRIPDWGHRVPSSLAAERPVASPPWKEDAFVIMSEKPMGYIVGLFGRSSRFTVIQPGAPGVDLDLSGSGPFAERVAALINSTFSDGIWIALRRPPTEYVLGYLRSFNLRTTNECQDVETFVELLTFCRLEQLDRTMPLGGLR